MNTSIDLDACFFVAESELHGKGLYARKTLTKADYLGTYDGPDSSENGMHVLWVEDDDGEWIGRDGQNLLRYINHSTKPNSEFDGFDLYALRKIKAQEEITIDYGEEFIDYLATLEEAVAD